MRLGGVSLYALLDGTSRRVLSRRLSKTLTSDCCVEAVQAAITRYGHPEILSTDQGCPFTSQTFSMDRTGRCRDNVFVKQLWGIAKMKRSICMSMKPSATPTRGMPLPDFL
jgi:putative transposase